MCDRTLPSRLVQFRTGLVKGTKRVIICDLKWCVLTAGNSEFTDLSVHREELEIHRTSRDHSCPITSKTLQIQHCTVIGI